MALPYDTLNISKKKQVESMFNSIAHRYDFLNHLLSFGIDKRWRKKLVKMLFDKLGANRDTHHQHILDIASGTGDLAFEIVKKHAVKVSAIDLSENMLNFARVKQKSCPNGKNIDFIKADGESLEFPDNSFDAVTIGFGIRNFSNPAKGLKEMYRVLRKNGILAILEFSKIKHPLIRFLFNSYFSHILPGIGRIFSKDMRAYTYLPESVKEFPYNEAFLKLLHNAGFTDGCYKTLSFGIATVYLTKKTN